MNTILNPHCRNYRYAMHSFQHLPSVLAPWIAGWSERVCSVWNLPCFSGYCSSFLQDARRIVLSVFYLIQINANKSGLWIDSPFWGRNKAWSADLGCFGAVEAIRKTLRFFRADKICKRSRCTALYFQPFDFMCFYRLIWKVLYPVVCGMNRKRPVFLSCITRKNAARENLRLPCLVL